MKLKIIIILIFSYLNFTAFGIRDTIIIDSNNTIKLDQNAEKEVVKSLNPSNSIKNKSLDSLNIKEIKDQFFIKKNMRDLDKNSSMNLEYNEIIYTYIEKYLAKSNRLIPKMLGLAPYYFPMIEQKLDKYNLPLELKYLSVVESALNPKARSSSGATGLWQFMYPTGKQYGLNVNSYIDERQDPLKSTEAACAYFLKLYEMFEDWNLVLAAYNAGPGYMKRKMTKTGINNYWELRPYLKKETQGYIPSFLAITYAMTYYQEHGLNILEADIKFKETDTITLRNQCSYYLISDFFCVSEETIIYLNPALKKDIFMKGDIIVLPKDIIMDFVLNEDFFYSFLERVDNKEILINERMVIYLVEKGDYLGKIANEYNISVQDIKEWNNLESDNLAIGKKLILYVPES